MLALIEAARALAEALSRAVNAVLDAVRAIGEALAHAAARRASAVLRKEHMETGDVVFIGDGTGYYPDGTPVDARVIIRNLTPRRTEAR